MHTIQFVKKPLREWNDEIPRGRRSEDNITTDSRVHYKDVKKGWLLSVCVRARARVCVCVCVCVSVSVCVSESVCV